ncbi:glycosyltransferase [Vibrio hepatarius]|nr:glycosyltransferase [Vibrio hepatarius]
MYPIRVGSEFLKRGYKVYGLCIRGTQVAKGMKEHGIDTFEVDSKISLIIKQLFKLNHWLNKRQISIIHSHKSGDIIIPALLTLLTKRCSFFTEHMGVTRPKTDLFHKWVYSHLDRVFSISNETYRRNLKALPLDAGKISQLWLGTDVSLSPTIPADEVAKIKQELSIPNESLVIGNVGRICIGKGQGELLEAFSLLQDTDTYPNLHLLLVGGLDVSEGSENNFVASIKARIQELQFKDRVHLVGYRKDTSRMLAIMDIVCLPNHNEAFGLTAIEAMAAQKAIIGANTGSLPEVLGETALLCTPTDPDSISKQLEKYLTSTTLRDINSNLAHQRALNEFSMEAHISKLTEHYTNKNGIL